jgi:LmbE family N-acetylglucosaminyl deacetylase
MTIFAHPDDETFGMAGTIRRATSAGHPVAVVCATRGEAGEIADPSLATKAMLGAVREGELRHAMAAVGVEDVRFLDYIDGRLPDADPDKAMAKIVRHLRAFRPDVVVTFAANGGYGHVDHMAIHRLTLTALRAAADPARAFGKPVIEFQSVYHARSQSRASSGRFVRISQSSDGVCSMRATRSCRHCSNSGRGSNTSASEAQNTRGR